jgi:putative aminopeptidase FrvX
MEGGDSLRTLLVDLLKTPGVCGFEEPIRRKIEELIRPLVDRLETDALGNLIATQEGQGERRVALFARMDELGLVDNRMITGRKSVRWPEDLAREKEIPIQRGVTGGSTDAAAVQLVRQGLAVLPICLPCRYTHSLEETVSLRDLEAAVSLIQEMLERLPQG